MRPGVVQSSCHDGCRTQFLTLHAPHGGQDFAQHLDRGFGSEVVDVGLGQAQIHPPVESAARDTADGPDSLERLPVQLDPQGAVRRSA